MVLWLTLVDILVNKSDNRNIVISIPTSRGNCASRRRENERVYLNSPMRCCFQIRSVFSIMTYYTEIQTTHVGGVPYAEYRPQPEIEEQPIITIQFEPVVHPSDDYSYPQPQFTFLANRREAPRSIWKMSVGMRARAVDDAPWRNWRSQQRREMEETANYLLDKPGTFCPLVLS